jgi:ribosomal protein S18 acetylase RimI-like enzyme
MTNDEQGRHFSIRRATRSDLPALGRLGAALMRQHFEFDPQRFIAPPDHPEEGYAWFLGTQLDADDAAILVAHEDDAILGYVYAAIEPMSWKELRDRCGYVHDVIVDSGHRRQGVASALMNEAFDWLKSEGAPRVVLGTASANEAAQRLFAQLGFRRTMIEMTREL